MNPPTSESTVWDVLVIGGGAAGLFAAASAAGRGLTTLVLEKNKQLGIKILMSGGTRCNITHACDRRSIARAFRENGKFLHASLAALPPQAVVDAVEAAGVPTKVESTGKIFPVSNRAIDVRDALVQRAREAGARFECRASVQSIRREDAGFRVRLADESRRARSVIVCVGGRSYPGSGTTGDGYAWAEAMGHTIMQPRPALTPLVSHTPWIHALQGIVLQQVRTSIVDATTHRTTASTDGDLLLTHFGLSGPAAMDLSRHVSERENPHDVAMAVNLFPALNRETLYEYFHAKKQQSAADSMDALIEGRVPKRFSKALFEHATIDPRTPLAETSKATLRILADHCHALRIAMHGTIGFKKAEVTAGGVALHEVDSKTLQSKIQQGLFFAGEILDLDGPIGGFNFQAAFSTGWLAGQCC